MSTDLFQALTLGLLVIVILALLVAVSMLGRIRASLETRERIEPKPDTHPEEPPADEVQGAPTEMAGREPVAEPEGADTAVVEEVAEPLAADTEAEDEADSERPFERGGRWYFRRGGELLVYEEGTGEWVTASASTEATPAIRSQADAVAASSEPPVADATEDTGATPTEEPAIATGSSDDAAAEVLDEGSASRGSSEEST
ncbi:MAG TPA: hypothetical protein VIG64_12720, partial [Actinomycetota bacterium]